MDAPSPSPPHRRAAPATLADIRHPGPAAADRRPFVLGTARPIEIAVDAGAALVPAFGAALETAGYGSAVVRLDGLVLDAFDYVMPDRAVDDRHVAWYSDTHASPSARLDDAVAIVGWRDGAWFAHVHARWTAGGRVRLGHLLPHTLVVAQSFAARGHGFAGGCFQAAPEPETEFVLYRVVEDSATASAEPPNALIATLAPFADLPDSVDVLAQALGDGPVDVLGLGSLAGTRFEGGSEMAPLISEVLLLPGAGGTAPHDLPLAAVDHTGALHEGRPLPGRAPTLVTFELMIVRKPAG